MTLATLPDALYDALGRVVADQRKEWGRERERIEADARALQTGLEAKIVTLQAELEKRADAQIQRIVEALATIKSGEPGRDGQDADPEAIAAMVAEAVAKIPPPVPGKDGDPGEDGKDADPELVSALVAEKVAEAVAALPAPTPGKDGDPGRDGKDVEIEDVEAMVAEHVGKAVAALPPAEPGKPGEPGRDGASVTVDDVAPLILQEVEKAMAALPPPKDGQDADMVAVERMVLAEVGKAVAALPPPQDGKDADLDVMAAMVIERVEKAVAALPPPPKGDPGEPGPAPDPELIARMVADQVKALPPPKDGIGLAGALIDRDGDLVLTLTDGTVRELGSIVGKDGEPGKPGKDGLSFDDFELEPEYDGERTIRLKWMNGGKAVTREWRLPIVIDRGVYRPETSYEKGDAVTFGGSIWIAQAETGEKPGNGDGSWRLAVKHGRDGKPGEPGKKGDPGKDGRDWRPPELRG